VRFQPNLEIGVLDDGTIAAFNFEATYRFRETWDVWTPYLGGGPSLNLVNRDGPGDVRLLSFDTLHLLPWNPITPVMEGASGPGEGLPR
jgi:hypothetical protein